MDFDSIVEHFGERIFNQALRVLGNREDAEEATNDVFMRIHRGLSDFRGESQLSTWIWRITTNVCLTLKARRRVQMVPLDAGEFRDDPRDDERDSNPEERLFAQEGGEQLAGLIAELPDQEGLAIALFYLQEMKYNEISAVLRIPTGSVATLLHRGRERLRKRILGKRKKP
jgi:RNA polymerase sigma-70 factor (ECF subfamily)